MRSLNIIGAGRVGKSLAYLFHQKGVFHIQQVLCQSIASASAAVRFIGAGAACDRIDELEPADAWFLSAPDDELPTLCIALRQRGLVSSSSTVFHASGTVGTGEMATLTPHHAVIHPILSFASPDYVIEHFPGTYCTVRGSLSGIESVTSWFSALGAQCVSVSNLNQPLYHTGLVFLSNYVVTLFDSGIACLIESGISSSDAKSMVMPLIQSVCAQVNLSAQVWPCLTGPISRGDAATVLNHLDVLSDRLPDLVSLYQVLGERALSLAAQQGLPNERYHALKNLLEVTHENTAR